MKTAAPKEKKTNLGELIANLFEETRKLTSDRMEQNFLVYMALKDLLRRIHTQHPVMLQP